MLYHFSTCIIIICIYLQKKQTKRAKGEVKRHEKGYKHLLRPAGNLFRKRR